MHIGEDELACLAIHQADTVSEQSGGEHAKNEELESRLVGGQIFPKIAHQHVESER